VRLAVRGQITLIVSELVLEEARRNLAKVAPDALAILEEVLQAVPHELAEPTKQQVGAVATYTQAKDAPIVAAAQVAKVDALLTFDKKHLLQPEVAKRSGLTIVTPGTFLQRWRATQEGGEDV
jgi:predicted nucleic acid-binding protein